MFDVGIFLAAMGKIDESKFDGAVGPLFIEGAKAGQTLKIEIESIETGEYGWCTGILW